MPLLVTIGCVSYPRPYPWNFPEAREWNQPLEFSWVNAVDNYRNLKSSKGKIWNPLVQDYEPDFGVRALSSLIKKSMKCINNPTLLAGQNSVGFVDIVMALNDRLPQSIMVKTKPFANPSGLVVDVCGLGLLASLAYRVESEVGIANLCILACIHAGVLVDASPQPVSALQWGAAF
jgi:hypothetical protein